MFLGLREIVFIITLTCNIFFFVFYAILGLEYSGIDESNSYLFFCLSGNLISFIFIFLTPFKLKNYLSAILILIPILISLLYFIEQPKSITALKTFQQYLFFSVIASYIGIYVSNKELLPKMAKWLEVIMIIQTLGIVSAVILPFLQGNIFSSLAGASYQFTSYISAFAFSLNLYFILFGENHELFKFHSLKIYKYLSYILLTLQLIGIFVSGGRGGFVLVILSTIILLASRKNKLIGSLGTIFLFTLIGLLFSVILTRFANLDVSMLRFDRIFSYISSGGIDMTQTSDRDIVYSDAINLIKQKPIWGYGVFKYYDYMGYPHNIFLEFLLQRGLVLLFLSFFAIIIIIYKLRKMIRYEKSNLLILPIFLYVVTLLMFSGTYLTQPVFWFSVFYILCYSRSSEEKTIINEFPDKIEVQ